MTYIDKFRLKLTKLRDGFLSEQGKYDIFMLGLREEIQKWVKVQLSHTTLRVMMYFALERERKTMSCEEEKKGSSTNLYKD